MPPQRKIVVGALNYVATPHPPGIYLALLQTAANKEVKIWGPEYGKITEPLREESDSNIWRGRVLLWTGIDKRGRWLDKEKNTEASEEDKKKIVIPDTIQPHFRSFYYALNIEKHRLILEYENEFGEHFGPSRAQRFFSLLLSPEFLGDDAPDVRITAIPEEESLTKILSIPRLRKLEIHLERPNAEDMTDEATRILKKLERQGAKKQELILIKAPKVAKITPDKETLILAKVASENGHVDGTGSDSDGKSISESTRDHPKAVPLILPEAQSSIGKFLSAIKLF